MLAELDDTWLARRYYGGDLPAEAERCLHLAAAHFADTATAEGFLAHAALIAPGHRLVDLGLYKFHFYKANLVEALEYAQRMVVHALAGLGLNTPDWRDVTPAAADFASLEPPPRFFLFALTAVGYLQLRLRRFDEARESLGKVQTLDTAGRMAAGRLLDLVDRIGQGEEDEE